MQYLLLQSYVTFHLFKLWSTTVGINLWWSLTVTGAQKSHTLIMCTSGSGTDSDITSSLLIITIIAS